MHILIHKNLRMSRRRSISVSLFTSLVKAVGDVKCESSVGGRHGDHSPAAKKSVVSVGSIFMVCKIYNLHQCQRD